MSGRESMEPQCPPEARVQDVGALPWREVPRVSQTEEARLVESPSPLLPPVPPLLLSWRIFKGSDLAWAWRSATQAALRASLQVPWSLSGSEPGNLSSALYLQRRANVLEVVGVESTWYLDYARDSAKEGSQGTSCVRKDSVAN